MSEPDVSRPAEETVNTPLPTPAQRLAESWQSGDRPAVQAFLAQEGDLDREQRLAVLRVDQMSRWERGERVLVESYLQQGLLAGDDEAILDLIYSEVVLREQRGEKPQLQEYLQRFPQYRAPLERQFALHGLMMASSSDSGDTDPNAVGPDEAGALPAAIGKYRVVSLLGEGGQAVVYRGVHPALGRDVAIKWSRRPLRGGAAERDRLLAEGRILAALEHPNLARVYDLDLHEGRPFLALEYVRGPNLVQHVQTAPPSPRQAALLVAQVARALGEVHRQGVVHQDLKPGNILIDETGRPRVVDFGLARVQQAWIADDPQAGKVAGSLAFMPSEQARGETERITPQSDVFALGGVLYFLLVKRPPLGQGRPLEVLERARRGAWDRETLQRAAVPRRLKAICARALAPEPADRHPRAEDLAADLEAFARRPWLLALWAAAAALAVLLPLLAVWLAGNGPHPPTTLTTQPAPEAISPLSVRVYRGEKILQLVDAAPLHEGDELQVSDEAAPDLHVSLFLFSSEGKLRQLASWPAGRGQRLLRYPEGQSVPLTGAPGTELLLVCCRRSGPVSLDEVQELWGKPSAWPPLPGLSVLRVDREEVRALQSGRDLGAPRSRRDTEEEVRDRLEALRERLSAHCDYLAGVAFAHKK